MELTFWCLLRPQSRQKLHQRRRQTDPVKTQKINFVITLFKDLWLLLSMAHIYMCSKTHMWVRYLLVSKANDKRLKLCKFFQCFYRWNLVDFNLSSLWNLSPSKWGSGRLPLVCLPRKNMVGFLTNHIWNLAIQLSYFCCLWGLINLQTNGEE